MNSLPIWYTTSLPKAVCDLLNDEFIKLQSQAARMGLSAESSDPNGRDTTLRFAEKDHWFTSLLYGIGLQANKECNWNYDINSHENIQYAEYGKDQHYAWHTDSFTLMNTETDRKITVICLMNDPSDYEGGDLHIKHLQVYRPIMEKGSIIAFPSFLEHRVIPVTSGKRFSSTLWLNGPRSR